MSTYDGDLKFDTKIDNSGVEKDLSDLRQKVEKVDSIKINADISSAKKEIEKLSQIPDAQSIKINVDTGNAVENIKKVTKSIEQQNDKIVSDAKQTGTQQSAAFEKSFQEIAKDGKTASATVTKSIAQIGDESKVASAEVGKMKDSMSGIVNAVKGVVLGYTGKKLVDYLLGSNAEMEQYLTSFEVMLGSASKAKAMMSDLTNFAAKTPLELTDVTKQATQLLNYGVSADKVIDKLTKLGDVSSGNAEKLESVTRAYGQMLSNGKVSLEDLNQMTEAGVPMLQALADTMNVSAAEMREMITAGKIGLPELDKALDSLTTGSGKFAGMMEKQAATMNGMLSTLKDQFAQFGRDVGEETFGTVKTSLNELMTAIDTASNNGTLEAVAQELGDAINSLVNGLISAVEFVYEYRDSIEAAAVGMVTFKGAMVVGDLILTVSKAVSGLSIALTTAAIAEEGATVAQVGLNTAMASNPIGIVLAAVTALTAGLAYLSTQIDTVSNTVKNYNSEMEKVKQNTQDNITNATSEGAVLKSKADIYEELRQKVNRTAEEEALLKKVAQELQAVLPSGTSLLNEQTGAYYALGTSIVDVVEKMKIQARLAGSTAEFEKAVQSEEKLNDALDSAIDKRDKYRKGSLGYILSDSDVKKAQTAVDEVTGIIDGYTETYTNAQKDLTDIDNKAANDAYKIQQQKNAGFKLALDKGIITQEQYNEKVAALSGKEVATTKAANAEIDDSFKTFYDNLKEKQNAKLITDDQFNSQLLEKLTTNNYSKLGVYNKYWGEVLTAQDTANKSAISAQEKADKDMQAEAEKNAKLLAEAQTKTFDQWSKEVNGMVEDYKTGMDEIVGARETMQKKLDSIGSLFKTEKVTTEDRDGEKTTEEVFKLTDLSETTNKLAAYRDALNSVKASGASVDFMNEVLAMNVDDAIQYVQELMKMTDSDMQAYFAQWQENKDLAKSIATDYYQSQIDTLNTTFITKFEDELKKMPADMTQVGTDTIDGFLTGLNNKKDSVKNDGQAIMQGVIDVARSVLGIHSPSTVFAGLAENTADGYIIRLKEKSAEIYQAIKSAFGDNLDKVMKEFETEINIEMAEMSANVSAKAALTELSWNGASKGSTTTIGNMFGKVADTVVVREDADLDQISNDLYARQQQALRSKGISNI